MPEDALVLTDRPKVLPGRECGSCTLCCKVYQIPEIGKVADKWCTHCKPGKGCAIHGQHPAQCARFNCLWQTREGMAPEWKPDQSKMVVTIHPVNGNVYVQVDPGRPSAWRAEPYHGHLRQWSRNNLQAGYYVLVFVGSQATLILPNEDMFLGPWSPTFGLSVQQRSGPNGPTYEVRVSPTPVAATPVAAPAT